MKSLGHPPFSVLWHSVSFRGKTAVEWALTKTYINPASVFRVFDLLYIQLKPYESKLSTALSERKAVARCATRKTDTVINRIKTVGGLRNCGHHLENTYDKKLNDR